MFDGSSGFSAKNSSKLNKFLHSEVNLLIQHIIVQDQDGQNNNVFNTDHTYSNIKTILEILHTLLKVPKLNFTKQ